MVTLRVRSMVWFATGVVLAVLATVLVMQTWRVDAAPGDSDSTFVPTAGCRVTDTRGTSTVGPRNTPLGADQTFTVMIHGSNGECTGALAIPTDAVGVALNVTAVNATASSNIRIFPADLTDVPLLSNLNVSAGAPPTPNKVDVKLSPDGKIKVYNFNGSVNIVIDIVGYYTDATLKELAAMAGTPGPAGPAGPAGPSSVNGTVIVPINFVGVGPFTDEPLATLNGITIKLDCPSTNETIKVTTTQTGGEISSISQTASSSLAPYGAHDDFFVAGVDVFVAGPGTGNGSADRQYTITYTAADGRNVIVHLVTEDNIGANQCVVSGFAMGAP